MQPAIERAPRDLGVLCGIAAFATSFRFHLRNRPVYRSELEHKAPEVLTTPGASFLGRAGGCFRDRAAPIFCSNCIHIAHSRRCVKTEPPRITNDSGRLIGSGGGIRTPDLRVMSADGEVGVSLMF